VRWVKHMTCANRDEKITRLIDECGVAGYGIYWLIVEAVAESLDKNATAPVLTHSMKQWGRLLYSHPNRLRPVLDTIQQIGLMRLTQDRDRLSLELPNLLKYRDEYASRVKKCRDTIPPIDTDTHTDTEADPPIPPAGAGGVSALSPEPSTGPSPDGENPPRTGTRYPEGTATARPLGEFDEWFERVFWPLFPRKKCKAAGLAAARRKMTTAEKRARAVAALERELPELLARPPEKRPHASTWFNQDRWNDEPEADPQALTLFRPHDPAYKAAETTRLLDERLREEAQRRGL
jgi:hypothetical protein